MTSEQMFKELGYKKEEDENGIYYERQTELSDRYIGFDKEGKQILINGYRWLILGLELQKAIFQQSKDLGWLDD